MADSKNPLLYKALPIRFLFKSLQFFVDGQKLDDLEKEPKTSELENWQKEFEVPCSRNTLLKMMGKPNLPGETITDRTLNHPAVFLLKKLPIGDQSQPFSKEELEEMGISSYKPKGAFRILLNSILLPEGVVNREDIKLIRSEENRYFYHENMQSDRELINRQVRAMIEYNFVAKTEEERSRIIESFQKDVGVIQPSFQRYFERTDFVRSMNRPLRVGFFRVLDGSLATFLKPVLRTSIDIDIVTIDKWGDGTSALDTYNLDAIIHAYPIALAGRIVQTDNNGLPSAGSDNIPYFFWPLFSFHGYALMARSDQNFKAAKNVALATELRTEFEPISLRYIEQNNPNAEVKLIDVPLSQHIAVAEGEDAPDYLFTNCINMAGIMGSGRADYKVIAQGKKLNYQNFNGIITSRETLNKRMSDIRQLAAVIYRIQNYFINELVERISSQNVMLGSLAVVSEDINRDDALIAESVTAFIKAQLGVELDQIQALAILKEYDDYYFSPAMAFTAFVKYLNGLEENHPLIEATKNTLATLIENSSDTDISEEGIDVDFRQLFEEQIQELNEFI